MKIAVTDANIFIDLIHLQWLPVFFRLPVHIHTTAEVAGQLNDEQAALLQPFILAQSLKIYSFSASELQAIHEMLLPRGLEMADKTVIYLAQQLQAQVLSGDGLLRKVCAKNGLEVNGIIWIFDNLLRHQIIIEANAVEKMELLLSVNSRLPFEECRERIKSWQNKKEP
jgi:predicted nucleic acid-binding protein